MRKEVWFGLAIMAFVVVLTFWLLPSPSQITQRTISTMPCTRMKRPATGITVLNG